MTCRPKRIVWINSWKPWMASLLLVVAVAVTFGCSIRFDFTSWDDPHTVAENTHLRPPTLQGVLHHWRHPVQGLYIPVTYTWWSMLAAIANDEAAGALHPGVFHLGNVVLHALSTIVAMRILTTLFGGRAAIATAGALLFALHPVQVESVAWVSGAKDLLAGLLALVVIDQLLRAIAADRRERALRHTAAMSVFLLAILAKPSAVVAPLIAAILISARYRRPLTQSVRFVWPMLLLAGVCVLWSRAVQAQWIQTQSPLLMRPLIAADAVAFYLGKLIWPLRLSILYGRTPAAVMASGVVYWTWLIPAAVTAALILLRRQVSWLLTGAAVFVMALLPVLGFARFMFQIHSTTADHYLYLPMLGIAIAAGGLLARWNRLPALAAAGALVVVLGALSFGQLRHWRNSETLFAHAVRVNPDSATARAGLAAALAQSGRIDEALPHFRVVVELSPTSRIARANLAQAYLLSGDYDAAVIEAEHALRLADPGADTSWEELILSRALATRDAALRRATPP